MMDPPAFERDALLARYDKLQSTGDILFKPSSDIVPYTDNGFPFEFRVAPSQKAKPIFPTDEKAPSRIVHDTANGTIEPPETEETKVKSDIDDGDPAWHICHINGTHRVIFNKYCIFRPQYLLMTKTAAHVQTSPLDFDDFRAAWTMLHGIEGPHYAIYNCGKSAGGSRMHKHMQIFEQVWEDLLPDVLLRHEGVRRSVPYRYKLEEVPQSVATGSTEEAARWLVDKYREHVRWCAETLRLPMPQPGSDAIVPHNIVMTDRFIMTIPRRAAGVGRATANAAGLIGLVWHSSMEIVDEWKERGPTKVLAELGVAA